MSYFGLHWSEQLRVAPRIELTDEQEVELTRLARSKRTSVRLAQRAQIVLLAAQGLQNKDIAEQLGVNEADIKNESNFVDDLGADSLDTVELVMALEEEFECEIPDEDAEKITTVQQAIDYVNANVKK